MNKVLVKLYVPLLEAQYDVWLPSNREIYNIIKLLAKIVNEFNEGYYEPNKMPTLYDKLTSKEYDVNLTVKESNIRNGTELILI